MAIVETAEWTSVQIALRAEVARLTGLLRAVRNPAAPALGRWNVAEVAMHLSQAWVAVPGLARQDLAEFESVVPGLSRPSDTSLIADLWDLSGLTIAGVESDSERDLRVIADRIEERAARFLASLEGMSPLERRPWLVDGSAVPLRTLAGHLLNETVMHGYDIARADGRRWEVDPGHARLVFETFLVPVLQALDPHAIVDPERAAGFRAVYQLHVRGGGRYVFAFNDGALEITPAASWRQPVDCHLSAEPAALLLVAWARRSQWWAISRGRLVAWGRKPWLGLRFRGLMRNP